jgi:hypothetical protein
MSEGLPIRAIAEHVSVSDDVVLFRMKVTRLHRGNRRTRRSRKAQ